MSGQFDRMDFGDLELEGIAVSTDVCVSHTSVSHVLADPEFIDLIFPPSPVVDQTSDNFVAFCSSPSASSSISPLPSSPSSVTDMTDEDKFLGNICGCKGRTARNKQAYTGLLMEALEAHPDGLSVAGLRKRIKDKHPTLAKHDLPQCTWQRNLCYTLSRKPLFGKGANGTWILCNSNDKKLDCGGKKGICVPSSVRVPEKSAESRRYVPILPKPRTASVPQGYVWLANK